MKKITLLILYTSIFTTTLKLQAQCWSSISVGYNHTINPIENASISVADLNGRIVYEVTSENLENKTIDLNHLQNGIYILNISNVNYNYSQKLVKQ